MTFFRKRRELFAKDKPKRHLWRILFRIGLICFGIGFVAIGSIFAWIAKDLPNPGEINKRVIVESTKIYDRTGTHLLYEVHGEEKRTVIPFADMPDVIKYATISLEDQDFYSHYGIKFTSIARALLKDIITLDRAQGGSTITQQFVKNTLLTNEKTLIRKVKEVILSLEIETLFSKDEILAMYLNEIPYGSNAYGIEAATQTFFGKPARELTLDEAALIASLPQATTYYSPYGLHRDALSARKNFTLRSMARLGYITKEQADQAIETPTLEKILPQKDIIAAPHFVMYIKDYLQQKYGDLAVEQGGLKVITTLDWEKQQIAEQAVRTGAENNKKWGASNAALVALDPKTGQILAMVGSKDYFDTSIDGNVNVAIRDRQPGSSFKPYVYLAAFTKGYLPETILYDVETQFETAEGKNYQPQNYDGTFHGPISMMKALGGSLNVPAVKTLYLVGVNDAVKLAKDLGIGGLNDPARVGLSLVLGGGEVKLLEHVSAYGALAIGGIKHAKVSVLRIEDSGGALVEEFTGSAGERIVEEKYVTMLNSVLANNENRAWIFGDNSPLRFDNRPVVAKTGTTNEFRDGWTVGYTPSLAVGVWAGNNDNSAMVKGADGVNVAAPIFREFLDNALVNYPVETFPKYNPEDEIGEGEGKTNKFMLAGQLETKKDLKVCKIPDKKNKYCIANQYCRDKDIEKKDFVSDHDILHYISRNNPRGPKPDSPDRDPQYKNWEKGVETWYEKQKNVVIAKAPDDECTEDDFSSYKPSITLTTPGNTSSSSITLTAKIDAPYGVDKVTYFINGSEVGFTSDKPYAIGYNITEEQNNSSLDIEVEIRDNNGNKAVAKKKISVSY